MGSIRVRCSCKGIDGAIRHVQAVRKSVGADVLRSIVEDLGKQGLGVAQAGLNGSEYAGDPAVALDGSWDGDTYKVTARGHAVLFIEFGSGVNIQPDNPKAPDFGFTPGGYSKGMIRANGWWFYRGQRGTAKPGNIKEARGKDGELRGYVTQGNPSANFMYDAGRWMHENVRQVVSAAIGREVR